MGSLEPTSLEYSSHSSLDSMGNTSNAGSSTTINNKRTRDLAICAVILDEWLKELAAISQEQSIVMLTEIFINHFWISHQTLEMKYVIALCTCIYKIYFVYWNCTDNAYDCTSTTWEATGVCVRLKSRESLFNSVEVCLNVVEAICFCIICKWKRETWTVR